MSRCKNDALISKIGAKKLQKEVETEFVVLNHLPDCRRINTVKRLSSLATAQYNMFLIPQNQFECMREGCVNTGTLTIGTGDAKFKAPWDAVEFADGVVTFYVSGSEGTLTFKISSDSQFKDADSYTVDLSKIHKAEDGFKAVVIDLAKVPTTVGEGWTPKHTGAYISIKVTPPTGESGTEVGLSSISIFDEMEDFETSATVRLACLSQLGGAFEFEAAEATCFGDAGIDIESIDSFEKTVTAKALTPNFHLLNPLYGKGEATKGWDTVTIETEVHFDDGSVDAEYGVITLPGKMAKECGFISVARANNCNVTDAHLKELRVPNLVDIDEGHFIVLDQSDPAEYAAEEVSKIYFNKSLVGETMVVAYPQVVEVEEFVFDVDNIRKRKVRWSYTRTYTDGVKWRFVFDNVIITSFPDELTEEEAEFEFTVTIQKDATGRFGRAYRITE